MDSSRTVLALDTSFFVFHQFFSARRRARADGASLGVAADLDRFVAQLRATISRKVREYDVPLGNLIFLMDCARSDIWRRRIYPEYKATRGDKVGFNTDAFETAMQEVIKRFEGQGAVVLSHPHAEADDLAAGVARWANACEAARLVIVTGDSDFLQLAGGRVHVHTIYGECALSSLACGDPQRLLLRKILMGDKSDNIPSIRPRMGPKAADSWMDKGVERMLADDPQARANYERNRTLVDLQCAPAEMLAGVDAAILVAFSGAQQREMQPRKVQTTFPFEA
jgi:5'-3' exonuclease